MLPGTALQDQSQLVGDGAPARPPVDRVDGYQLAHLVATQFNWEDLGVDPKVIPENCARVAGRFAHFRGLRDEPAAIVAYGDSLLQTWERIKDFKVIFSCSGSHKFLLERGIVPTYHVDSDPRTHKVVMLGTPHPDVTYLVSSICHPTYFDLLERHQIPKVLLWHLLYFEPHIYDLLPRGEWLLTGGNTVGPRTVKMARLLGYAEQHLFGFDASAGYAGFHPHAPKKLKPCEYDGKTYWTTHNWVEHAKWLFTDMDRMPEVKAHFYGKGLIQAMAKNYVRKAVHDFPMGIIKT